MQLSEAEQKLLENYNGQLERFIREDYLGFFPYHYQLNFPDLESPILKLVTATQTIFSAIHSKDPLTGLWSRKLVLEYLEQAIVRTRDESTVPVIVVLFDIDKLKYVQDMLGLTKGDEVIQNISQILAKRLQPFHFVGRYGGDEFLAILNAPMDETKTLINKIHTEIAALANLIPIPNLEARATMSIVLTQVTREDTLDSCLVRVEGGMQHAKNTRRNDIWIV